MKRSLGLLLACAFALAPEAGCRSEASKPSDATPVLEAEVFPRIEAAKRLRAEGKADEALAALAGLDTMTGDERAAGLALRARLRLSRGEVDAAIEDFRAAIAQRDPRRASEDVVDGVTLAFALSQRSHRFVEAEAALDEAAARAGEDPESRALVAYHRALVAYETGDMRRALVGLDESAQRAAQVGDVWLARASKSARALALLSLGRRREAIASIVALRRESGPAKDCMGVALAIDLSWAWASCGADDSQAACGVSSDEALTDAESAANEAIDAFPAICPDPSVTANALVNAALVRLVRGDARGTTALLERSRRIASKPDAGVELFWLDLENRVLLANGEARRALAGFERERTRAEALLATSMQWRAEIGIAGARDRLGDVEGAIAACERAEASAAEESLAIPLGEGRASFLAEREAATTHHVDLLLRRGRDADALDVARRARIGVLEPLEWTRKLAQLDPSARARRDAAIGTYRQRRAALESEAESEWALPKDEWQRASDNRRRREAELAKLLEETLSGEGRSPSHRATLRAPDSGETLLVYHRASDHWVGFARTASGVVARVLEPMADDASPEDLSRALLEPFDAEILASTRVTVLASGSLRAVDFHALPWRGAPLVEHASVAYGLDLPVEAEAAPASQTRALVVGDPSGDLLAARDEATAVAAALRENGWTVDAKIHRDARAESIRVALPNVDLLHYAGHGVFGGVDGWESALPLADSAKLSVGDLLSLPHAPRLVVLAGCETARGGDAKSAAGLGLAQSLLVAGSSQVLASSRLVDDATSARVMALLYARSPGDASWNLVDRLAEAQRVLWHRADSPRWQDLRVFVR